MPSLNTINLLTQATARLIIKQHFGLNLQADLRILSLANYATLCKIEAARV
jgi:hypothetical protein